MDVLLIIFDNIVYLNIIWAIQFFGDHRKSWKKHYLFFTIMDILNKSPWPFFYQFYLIIERKLHRHRKIKLYYYRNDAIFFFPHWYLPTYLIDSSGNTHTNTNSNKKTYLPFPLTQIPNVCKREFAPTKTFYAYVCYFYFQRNNHL